MTDQPSYQPPPAPQPRQATLAPAGSRLHGLGSFILVIGVLGGLAAVIGGIILAVHKVAVCDNPYDASICDGTSHPFVAAGIGMIIGGIIEAIVICTVGHLAQVVAELRSRTTA